MLTNRYALALLTVLTATALAHAEEVRGVVTKCDPDGNCLVIDGRGLKIRGETLTFTFAPNVEILFGRQRGLVVDVTAGKHVRVVYEMQEGKRIAVTVHVNGAKPAPPKSSVPPPVPAGEAADANTLTGQLRRVARTELQIVVAAPGESGKEVYTTLPVATDAKLTRDGKTIVFDDLKEDERAVVRTEMRQGKRTATAILVGQVNMADMKPAPAESSKIAKLRLILQIADKVLEIVEERQKQ